MEREGLGRQAEKLGRSADRHLSAVRGNTVRRVLLGALIGLVVLLGSGLPVAADDAPNSLDGLSATYDVSAALKWKKGRLNVTSTALVTNNSGAAVTALTFNAAPAKIGKMIVNSILVGGQSVTGVKQDQNIIVPLPTPLEDTQQVSVAIAYSAWFGGTTGNKRYLFAKVEKIATAYRWIPWLSKAYDFITPTYGEPFVTKATDEVRVRITPDQPNIKIATSGQLESIEGNTQTFVAHNVRDFNFAASPRYVKTTTQWGDVTVTYYTIELPLAKTKKWVMAALNRFKSKIGPYPYPTFTIAEVPTGPSMESPAMIWITQSAVPRGTLKYLAVHETAHMWFYAIVGNNQADEPFTDEAMAEFLTRDFIGHRASHCSDDILDKRVYDYSSACYYETIYVQGELYLEAYRQQVGDANFWVGVRAYYEEYKFRIGSILKLFEALDAASGGTGGGHGDRFPGIFGGQ